MAATAADDDDDVHEDDDDNDDSPSALITLNLSLEHYSWALNTPVRHLATSRAHISPAKEPFHQRIRDTTLIIHSEWRRLFIIKNSFGLPSGK